MKAAGLQEELRRECPSLEQLTALFEKRLGVTEATTVEGHIAGCTQCEADWRMLGEFAEGAVEAAEAADVRSIVAGLEKTRKPKRSGWFAWAGMPQWAGALAALVMVVAVGMQWQARKSTDLSGFQESGSLRSSEQIAVVGKGDFSALPAEFSWTGVNSAVSYLIVVSEVDGTELWRGTSTQTRLALAEQLRAILLPKKTVVLQVTALDGNGNRLASSDATRMRYVPEGESR